MKSLIIINSASEYLKAVAQKKFKPNSIGIGEKILWFTLMIQKDGLWIIP